ncbi:GTPase HflX [Enterococcus pallens]|uniref:GTPase HflX n=1 Tax=Enterococcus pallens ATCC BAA-351 TaxID=1158607 RepID=R2QHY5_9ENTE|nr:GTPase HflX [Enterococcus pallens]EOH96202.1 GTP-binding protein HflX [Enterococcus pallens ATCC BAA-351]EOU14585.1 GTP-binding protein HflX [Enterococcus pallens ATCC BAA-351]OJG80922.1 GTP-binding protein HflX [Enterococcus pallens]
MSEKVILVGVETEENKQNYLESMHELAGLTKTAHGEIVFSMTQKRPKVDRQTIIGKGKVEELAQLVDAHEAELVIFNHAMTPRQSQTVEEIIGVPVIDRIQLILDIFAQRARSKEGKLQVELAQLNYLLPRLMGQGHSLSRLGGGIGTRGPGETKLETDRRHIRNRISAIKKELKNVEAHRERSRQKRQQSNIFQMGLIGYTNAGKSTILNLLTNAETYSKDQLFATLDPLTKRWQLPQGMQATITDTVGFIQDLPTQLIDAFHSTLEESKGMDLLLHVVDASSEDRLQQEQTVMNLLKELEMDDIPILTIYNKADRIDPFAFTPTLFPNTLISAKSSKGKEILAEAIKKEIMELLEPYLLTIKAEDGQSLHAIRRESLVLSETFEEEKEVYQIRGFAKKSSVWIRRMDDELDS